MNAKDKQDLELITYRLDELDKKIDEIKHSMSMAHDKTEESLRFLKLVNVNAFLSGFNFIQISNKSFSKF